MKNTKLMLLAGLLGLALTGCGQTPTDSSSSGSDSSESSSSSELPADTITNDDLPKAQTTFVDEDGETQELNIDRLFRNSNDPHVINITPESGTKAKLLVAPITFEADASDPNDTIRATDDLYEKIRIAFTGTPEETAAVGGYISVQEFYNQSSYNKGGFDVVVLPCWVNTGMTPTEFNNSGSTYNGVKCAEFVREWYQEEWAKDGHGELGADWEYEWTDFDSDGDGFVDLIWSVYTYPSDHNQDWWAYVTYTSNSANVRNPTVKTIAFASTDFMSSYNGYDSHTFIHETGHTYGLNDYYDYNNTWKPMGSVDYMDQNLGDHCAYSKFTLGWVNPWVLRESDIDGTNGVTTAKITLRPLTNTGDCLVLASPNYNNTAFDEYLMVELVGPYGLAEKDYLNGYSGTTGFTEPGIRITHVDARVSGNSELNSTRWTTWRTDADDIGQNGTTVRLSNTYGGRSGVGTDSDFWDHTETTGSTDYAYMCEIGLIEASIGDTNCMTSPSYNAGMSSLFTAGSRFYMGDDSTWMKNFFPSRSGLWNKAQTFTSDSGRIGQRKIEIDETCTSNFSLRVNSIVEDEQYGAVATLTVTLI